MASILAIDTSTNACSVALLHQNTINEDFIVVPQSHTQRLLPMIEKLLSDNGLTINNLDAIALTIGPGSFTGLRIGLGVAQGLAFGSNLPLIGLSSLLTMALAAKRLLKIERDVNIVPCFNARMSEVYWSCYNLRSGSVNTLIEDSVELPEDMIQKIDDLGEPFIGIGDGWPIVDENLIKKLSQKVSIELIPDFYPHACDLAALAEEKFNLGEVHLPAELNPAYVRNEVSWKKRQRIRQTVENNSPTQ